MCKLTKEEEYSIISRTMTNIRSLRTYVRELDFEQLLDMQEKLNTVIEERREDAERKAAERKELETKCQQVFEYIVSVGLDPEEWQGPVSAIAGTTETKRKPKGGVRKAKYIFEDENGETRRGLVTVKCHLLCGNRLMEIVPLETFLIEKPNQHEQSE